MNKPTQLQKIQITIFIVFLLEFIAFSCGFMHVPIDTEDSKFFYMLFGVFNTILSVKAFSQNTENKEG